MDELEIKHGMLHVNGINMHVAEKGAGPVVLLLHGFPEFWYGWRHQLIGLARQGFHAVAPDLRGYGDSSVPPETDSYTILHLVGDIVALMDVLEQTQEPGVAEAEIARLCVDTFMKKVFTYHKPEPFYIPKEGMGSSNEKITLPYWITEEDINYYVKNFEKTGFTGPLNYYRCLDLSWDMMSPWSGAKITVPTKFIIGDHDMTYHSPGIQMYVNLRGMEIFVPGYEDIAVLKGVGHFLHQERAKEVTDHICDFVRKF